VGCGQDVAQRAGFPGYVWAGKARSTG